MNKQQVKAFNELKSIFSESCIEKGLNLTKSFYNDDAVLAIESYRDKISRFVKINPMSGNRLHEIIICNEVEREYPAIIIENKNSKHSTIKFENNKEFLKFVELLLELFNGAYEYFDSLGTGNSYFIKKGTKKLHFDKIKDLL